MVSKWAVCVVWWGSRETNTLLVPPLFVPLVCAICSLPPERVLRSVSSVDGSLVSVCVSVCVCVCVCVCLFVALPIDSCVFVDKFSAVFPFPSKTRPPFRTQTRKALTCIIQAGPPSLSVSQVMLVGDSGVGKTCLLVRFKDGAFLAGSFISTVGIDFRVSAHTQTRFLEKSKMKFFGCFHCCCSRQLQVFFIGPQPTLKATENCKTLTCVTDPH